MLAVHVTQILQGYFTGMVAILCLPHVSESKMKWVIKINSLSQTEDYGKWSRRIHEDDNYNKLMCAGIYSIYLYIWAVQIQDDNYNKLMCAGIYSIYLYIRYNYTWHHLGQLR